MEVTLPISSFMIIAVDSVGVILALSLSIALIIKKEKNHRAVYLFSLLLLLTGLTLLNDMFSTSGLSNRFKDLYFLPIYYSLSIGPLFYLLIKTKNQNKYRWYDILHLLLPIGQAFVYFFIGFRSTEFKGDLWSNSSFPIYLEIETFLFPISIISYGLLSINLVKRGTNNSFFWTEDLKSWLTNFTKGFLLIASIELILSVGDYFLNIPFSPLFFVLRSCTFVAFVLWISFNAVKQYYPSNIYLTKHKIKKALVPNDSLEEYAERMNELMEEQKVFLNPDLNLKLLASYLEIPEKVCSHVLSKSLDTNFNKFINHHRIEAFKEKILEGQHKQYTLTSIAYDCGFESKSTFNRAFKLSTNMSPSLYIKSL